MSGEEFLAAAGGAEDAEALAVAYVLIEDGEISPRRVVAKVPLRFFGVDVTRN